MAEQGVTGAGIGILVLRGSEVLLGLRNSDPAKADSELHGEGSWTMPGGKIRLGESFEQAAERELVEETGVVPGALRVISLANDTAGEAHFVTIGLLCEHWQGEVTTREPEEITEWRWFDLHTLPPNLFPPSQKIVNNYLAGTFYTPA